MLGTVLLAMTAISKAVPTVTFPINSQVPPVARVGLPFDFIFSASTFASTTFSLQYALSAAPTWLRLDSASRTLSGTPSKEDTGPCNFELIATDNTGSTTLPVTLIVSSNPGPGLGVSISDQLPTFGVFSSPDTLLFYPSVPISISFKSDTFTNTDENTVYYASCTNNTPLPSWINFDADNLSLVGSTPESTSPIELPQIYGIEITASDYVGFSGAVASFQLIISSHELTFGVQVQTIQVAPGRPFNYSGIQNSLLLDGKPVEISDLQGILAECPPWMSLDPETLTLSGTAPASASSQNFSVLATDRYGDEANTTILISVESPLNLIHGTVGILNAAIGSVFDYNFSRSLFPVVGSRITVDMGLTSSWLHFDDTSLSLFGNVPVNLKPQIDQLNLTASKGGQTQSQSFSIALRLGLKGTATSTYLLPTQSRGASPTASLNPTSTAYPSSGTDASSNTRKEIIALALVIPLIILCLIGLYRCRRKKGQKGSRESYIHAVKRKISRPLCQEKPDFPDGLEYPTLCHRRLPSKAPKLEIPSIAPEMRTPDHRTELPTKTDGGPQISLPDLWQSAPSIQEDIMPVKQDRRPDSSALPQSYYLDEDQVPLRRPNAIIEYGSSNPRLSRILRSSKRESWLRRRHSDRVSVNSNKSFFSRATGLGHGYSPICSTYSMAHERGSYNVQSLGPPGCGAVSKSWRSTCPDITNSSASTPYGSRRPHTLQGGLNNVIKAQSSRLTLRRVTSSDLFQKEQELQQYIKNRRRHKDQSPLFSGGPSVRKVSSAAFLSSRAPSSAVEAPKRSDDTETKRTSVSNLVKAQAQPRYTTLYSLPHSFSKSSSLLHAPLVPPPTPPSRSPRRALLSFTTTSTPPSYRRRVSPGKPPHMASYLQPRFKRSRSTLSSTEGKYASAEENEDDDDGERDGGDAGSAMLWEDIDEGQSSRAGDESSSTGTGKIKERDESPRPWLHTSLGPNPLTVHPNSDQTTKSIAGSILETSPIKSAGGSVSMSLRESKSLKRDRSAGLRESGSFTSFRRGQGVGESRSLTSENTRLRARMHGSRPSGSHTLARERGFVQRRSRVFESGLESAGMIERPLTRGKSVGGGKGPRRSQAFI